MMVPIHYAVLKNNFKMVRFLIEHKQQEVALSVLKKQRLEDQNSNKSPERNKQKKS